MDGVILEKWLRCGFLENSKRFATEEGTPQGGIVSPTLANLTLDGLESLLKAAFPSRKQKGKQIYSKVHLVRYADDFIITGRSQSLLVNEVLPLVERFLRERGLELSAEKTHLTHIQKGFDFLGQNIRKYGGKLLITPAQKNVQAALTKLRGIIEKNKSATQENLIVQLNPVIRGWANYHRHCVAKRAFARMDFELWRKLWWWSARRHPQKSAAWVKNRYYHAIGERTWRFAARTATQSPRGQSSWKQLLYAGSTTMYIDGDVPYITRIAEEQWSDDRTGETYNVSDLVHKFRDVLPDKLKVNLSADPEWLKLFRDSISVHLVETQRLLLADSDVDLRRYRPKPLPHRRALASTVKNYSSNLRGRMANALMAYAEHSQTLDRSFPQRMLGGPKTEALDTANLKDRMNKLEQRRSQLKKIGFIEDDTSYPFDIDTLDTATPMQKAVMTLYVEDTENKLGLLDGLEEKVDLLLGNINRKFRPNKQLRADRFSGLIVRDKKNLRIDLDSLSSGEQHELVLIYGLLFQVSPQSLVLIDEPELSLHVTWQKVFLTELFAIVKSVNFDVLIATHSPFIVGDRLDLMVPLALDANDMDAVSTSADGQPLPVR